MENSSQPDHDLLIELRTELRGLRIDFRDIKDGLANRLAIVEVEKMGKSEILELKKEEDKRYDDHENRLRMLERWVWTAIGALAVIQIVISLIK